MLQTYEQYIAWIKSCQLANKTAADYKKQQDDIAQLDHFDKWITQKESNNERQH